MGKGRDKRKKHEGGDKAVSRAQRTVTKAAKGVKRGEAGTIEGEGTGLGGLNNEEDVVATIMRLKRVDAKRKSAVEIDIDPPPPRVNGVMIAHPTRDNELVIFGGELWDGESTKPFNDLVIFNATKNAWRQIKSPLGPSPRSSCQAFTYKNCIYIHGGEFVSPTQSQYMHFRDCFRMDMTTGVWEELAAGGKGKGPCPSARSGHRIALWKRSAVSFGGFYDNALENKYFDDLWMLSDLEGDGHWAQVILPPHAEVPHRRSGHAVAVYKDDFFVYGGYFTEKVSRFRRAEATVLHDLWCINLAAAAPVWNKIRLGGVPMPIRSGIGFAVKEKRLLLFGGVVDVDAPGGQTNSTFHNDIFAFHMDNRKFFPLVLAKKKQPAGKAGLATLGKAPASLAAEVEGLIGAKLGDSDDSDDDDDDELDDGAHVLTEESRFTHSELSTGQVLPCKRMNAMLCVLGNTLYVNGGQYEIGKMEITMCDMLSINLKAMDTYAVLRTQDLTAFQWLGKESEASGSWEDGSTVADLDALAAMDDLDDDDQAVLQEEQRAIADAQAETVNRDGATAAAANDDDDDDDDDECGKGLAAAVKAATLGDGRTTTAGKAGLQKHKVQLQQQLSAANIVPTPQQAETLREFFARTAAFWMASAAEAADVSPADAQDAKVAKRLKRDAFEFCKMRHEEAVQLLEQLATIDAQQREERDWLRAQLQMRRQRQAEMEAADAEESEEDGYEDHYAQQAQQQAQPDGDDAPELTDA
jgi:hypothetical protein